MKNPLQRTLGWMRVSLSLLLLCAMAAVLVACSPRPDPSAPSDVVGTNSSVPSEDVSEQDQTFPVYLSVDGVHYTCAVDGEEIKTVGDLLLTYRVTLGAEDEINYDLSAQLEGEMTVQVGRVTYEESVEKESIPYGTQQVLMSYTFNSAKYAPRLKNTAGVPGVREVTKRTKLVDGVAVETKVVSSVVVSEPTDAKIYVDASYLLDLGDGPPESYERKFACEFTAYSYDEEGDSYTYSGDIAKVGYVAVDRSVIPIHSYLYVVLDNGFVYGYCYAKDTGGAIKGNIIDIFLPTDEDCRYFGRLQGTVYVISSGS